MGLEQSWGTCFENFNPEILSNARKPAHPWLAPCWNGQALTLDSSTRWPWRSRDAGVRASTQKKTIRARMRAHHVCGLRAPQAADVASV